MKRLAVAILTALTLIIPATAAANAAPPANARWVGGTSWGGWVTVDKATLYSDAVSYLVTIQATKGTMPINPYYFVAKAEDGTRYNSPIFGGQGALDSGQLPAGERVKGYVTLKVWGPKPTILIYESPLGDQLAKWQFTWKANPKPKPPKVIFKPLS